MKVRVLYRVCTELASRTLETILDFVYHMILVATEYLIIEIKWWCDWNYTLVLLYLFNLSQL